MNYIPVLKSEFIKVLLRECGVNPELSGDCEIDAPINGVLGLRVRLLVTEEALLKACEAMLPKPESPLTVQERAFLKSAVTLWPDAYGDAIFEEAGKGCPSLNLGELYLIGERLENRGYVTARFGDATPERGDRPKKFWALTEKGRKAIE